MGVDCSFSDQRLCAVVGVLYYVFTYLKVCDLDVLFQVVSFVVGLFDLVTRSLGLAFGLFAGFLLLETTFLNYRKSMVSFLKKELQ